MNNELRIGNLVSCQVSDKHQITGEVYNIQRSTIRCYVDNELEEILVDNGRFNPIPLTEEWLLKFGFDLTVKQGNQQGFRVYRLNEFTYNTIHGWWWHGRQLILQPEHVHQLQNLYWCLTGEELTIK